MPNYFKEVINMTTAVKNREQQLRRALYKAGYQLHKSRKAFSADNLGGYMIVDYYINGIVSGSRFELDLEGVEEFVSMYCN